MTKRKLIKDECPDSTNCRSNHAPTRKGVKRGKYKTKKIKLLLAKQLNKSKHVITDDDDIISTSNSEAIDNNITSNSNDLDDNNSNNLIEEHTQQLPNSNNHEIKVEVDDNFDHLDHQHENVVVVESVRIFY